VDTRGSTRNALALAVLAVAFTGCAAPLAVRPATLAVDAHLDPAAQTLAARARLELRETATRGATGRRGRVELKLNPDLVLESVRAEGATLLARKTRRGRPSRNGAPLVPARHRLLLAPTGGTLRLTLDYRGRLAQDVAAGEKEGQIHNLVVSAHIGDEGVYLDDDGYWYPVLSRPADADPAEGLVDFHLSADPVPGFELVAGLDPAARGPDARLRWRSPFPLDGMVLLGGPRVRASRPHGDVLLHAVLPAGKEDVARDILDAAAENLDRYVPLVGPYPFREFTVLEAFFSSGFAFPGSTQIVGSQLGTQRQYRRHGYLDHELLHNWWGNGVLVDPRDGNWCEGLASYLGNYFGHVLDGDEAGARKERRNQSNFLSRLEPGEDLPLGTFGLDGGAGRGIGYMKGAAVFHMLERKIGDALFAGLRRLTAERMGRHTSWDDIRAAMETASGADLGPFFEQWVRRGGAPPLRLAGADWRPGSTELRLTLSQEPAAFALDVPLRLFYGERTVDVVVPFDAPAGEVRVPCEGVGLTAVELDPDYHVFRQLAPAEIMPTSGLTRGAAKLLIVVPPEPLAEPYRQVVDSFTRAVAGDGADRPPRARAVRVVEAAAAGAADLAASSVLIVGDAVRAPAVAAFLARTRSPVAWTADGFRIDDEVYGGPGHAVLLTVHHPDRPADGVTVYRGNSLAALANARVLGFYANSLLVFESPAGELVPDGGPAATKVVRRTDFEFHDRIEF